ncbi:hypothetical protein O3M35_008094 [Rhynocoris fuscipes]|uniref:Amidase domain-containing protein n=1 Tax=Rhynocoris fuscipes TaxID=488301 RepID=A0AAW1D558_9HEMI
MELIIFFTVLQKFLSWISRPIYFIISLRSTPKLPSIASPYLQMSVVEIAKKIRNGEVKSRDVVDACIERIRKVNPILNAVVDERFKEAQSEADEADNFIAANKNDLEKIAMEKPLLGVPFTVKESCKLKGMSLSVGCLPLKGQVATEDGEAVSKLRNAGAIPLCVTNTPELCLFWESYNLVTGCTRNPYNLHRTSGGSSGGEGALIGSGSSLFGIGSDLAGSIRIPSLFNGIFGHKPTPGLVSIEGHYPMATHEDFKKYLTVGPMARHAEDLIFLMKILSTDPDYSRLLDEKIDLSNLNVFYIEEATNVWYAVPVENDIKAKIQEAAEFLKTTYGCKIQKGPFDELENSAVMGDALLLKVLSKDDVFKFSLKEHRRRPNDNMEFIKAIFGLSKYSLYSTLANLFQKYELFSERKCEMYSKQNDELKLKFKDVLKDNGVLLYPTFPKPAIHHLETASVTQGIMYALIANTLCLPATHVPLGFDRNGLPIGFQVIAAPYQDRLCLAVAKALEDKFGGWIPPS